MKRSWLAFILLSFWLIPACRQKAKPEKTETPVTVDPADPEKIPETSAPSGTTRSLDNNTDILANIDKYLVSTPEYQPPNSLDGGISNATVVVRNEIPNISIQKALVEVSILLTDGKEYRTDYYTVINIEPGESKTFRIPVSARGQKLSSRIVKLKSTELTNGEMILVGDRYIPH